LERNLKSELCRDKTEPISTQTRKMNGGTSTKY